MKKRFAKKGIIGAMLMTGLVFMSCASIGTAHSKPPDGKYDGYQGGIVFSAADSSWEARGLGYRGSFDFNKETGSITLNAGQSLRAYKWVDIDPITNFSSGQIKGERLNLGDFMFFLHKYDEGHD
jgi:hypothetical protein